MHDLRQHRVLRRRPEQRRHVDPTDCTIANNTAKGTTPTASGSGIYDYAGTVGLENTIVASNTAPAGTATSTAIRQLRHRLVQPHRHRRLGRDHQRVEPQHRPDQPLHSGAQLPGQLRRIDQTIALLPGSTAIGKGTSGTSLPTADQRGKPLDSPSPDIGTFQSQGFTLTVVSGDSPQSTTVGTAFPNPLAVTVAARNSVEPVTGGVLSFTRPRAALGEAVRRNGNDRRQRRRLGHGDRQFGRRQLCGHRNRRRRLVNLLHADQRRGDAGDGDVRRAGRDDLGQLGRDVRVAGRRIQGYTASLPSYATVASQRPRRPHLVHQHHGYPPRGPASPPQRLASPRAGSRRAASA